MTDFTRLSDEDLRSQFLVADKKWETDRRAGGWNLPQREARNDLMRELMRRQAQS